MSKLALPLLVAALICLLPSAALADGKAYLVGKDMDYRSPLPQHEQRAILSHHDGTERLLIAINIGFEEDTAGAFWLFPVPGTPETVKIDLLDKFPVMRGVDPVAKARNNITTNFVTETALVVNPLLGVMTALLPALSSHRGLGDAVIHAQVEKYGLQTQVITASSTESLLAYLAGRGLDMPRKELALFEPYLDDKHVLIATHIMSSEELRERFPQQARWETAGGKRRWPGVYVTFPTEKPFYPMRPTSGYGHTFMRVNLAVIGHATPEGDAAMLSGAECHYYMQKVFNRKAFPDGMLDGIEEGKPLLYTRLTFSDYANTFTSDLTFDPRPGFSPLQVAVFSFAKGPLMVVKFFALLYICGGLCGLIYMGEWWQPASYGLTGVLSFVAVSHFTWRDLVTPGFCRSRVSAFTYALSYLCMFVVLNTALRSLLLRLLST